MERIANTKRWFFGGEKKNSKTGIPLNTGKQLSERNSENHKVDIKNTTNDFM